MKITKEDIITTDGYLSFCNDNNICYIKTDFFYVGEINWRGERHPKNINDVCVIGHSDYPVTDNIVSNFKTVFCINRQTSKPNTYGLPLGLTNDCDDSPLHRIYGNKEIVIDVINEHIDKSNLVYMNFNTSTFSERPAIWNFFEKFNWVKVGEIENTLNGRKSFLREMKSSKFVVCPRGNGVDTHRMWEALYMGSIPIVKYEDNTHHLFTDLPILWIKEWSEINEEFLENKYSEITNKVWNLNKLKLSYWEKFIKSKINI